MTSIVVNRVEVVDATNTARVTLSRAIGPLVVTPAAAGGLALIDTPAEFGIGSDGAAYFSLTGVTKGDHAQFAVDGAGNPQLISEGV